MVEAKRERGTIMIKRERGTIMIGEWQWWRIRGERYHHDWGVAVVEDKRERGTIMIGEWQWWRIRGREVPS